MSIPIPGGQALSPKAVADLEQGGGRHYHGAGLGPVGRWECPQCGSQRSGAPTTDCPTCVSMARNAAPVPAGQNAAPTAQQGPPSDSRRPASPLLATALAPPATKLSAGQLLLDIRSIVREELAEARQVQLPPAFDYVAHHLERPLIGPPPGALLIHGMAAPAALLYAISTGLQIVAGLIESNGANVDPLMPSLEELYALNATIEQDQGYQDLMAGMTIPEPPPTPTVADLPAFPDSAAPSPAPATDTDQDIPF